MRNNFFQVRYLLHSIGSTQYLLAIYANLLHHCLESSKILLATLESLAYADFEGLFRQNLSVLKSNSWLEIADLVEQPNHLLDEGSIAKINHFVLWKRREWAAKSIIDS